MFSFADRLKSLRSTKKISQKDLGDQLGVSQQTVAKWEVSGSTPDPYMLAKIAQVFQISADYLVGLSDDPKQRDLTPAEREALQKAAADIKGYETTDEELAAKLPADIREGILALIRLERDKHNNN